MTKLRTDYADPTLTEDIRLESLSEEEAARERARQEDELAEEIRKQRRSGKHLPGQHDQQDHAPSGESIDEDLPRWQYDERDTPQQRAALRDSRAAQRARQLYPPGTRVVVVPGVGAEPKPDAMRGTVDRHVPGGDAQGGYLVVTWDSGVSGRITPVNVIREDGRKHLPGQHDQLDHGREGDEANETKLTPAQQRMLDDVRSDGERRYNGRARRTVEALQAAGLVTVEYDLQPHANIGSGISFTEVFIVRPVEGKHLPGQHDQLDHGHGAGERVTPRGEGGRYSDVGGLGDTALERGGFSLSLEGDRPKRGWMVSQLGSERSISIEQLAADQPMGFAPGDPWHDNVKAEVDRFVRDYREDLSREGAYLGGWVQDDRLFLDVSFNFTDEDEAARFARENRQFAMYNAETGEYREFAQDRRAASRKMAEQQLKEHEKVLLKVAADADTEELTQRLLKALTK